MTDRNWHATAMPGEPTIDPDPPTRRPKMYAVTAEVLNALALELPAEVHADVMRRAVPLPDESERPNG